MGGTGGEEPPCKWGEGGGLNQMQDERQEHESENGWLLDGGRERGRPASGEKGASNAHKRDKIATGTSETEWAQEVRVKVTDEE